MSELQKCKNGNEHQWCLYKLVPPNGVVKCQICKVTHVTRLSEEWYNKGFIFGTMGDEKDDGE